MLHALHTCQRAQEEGTFEEWQGEGAMVVCAGREVETRLHQRLCPCTKESTRLPTTTFCEVPVMRCSFISDFCSAPPLLLRTTARPRCLRRSPSGRDRERSSLKNRAGSQEADGVAHRQPLPMHTRRAQTALPSWLRAATPFGSSSSPKPSESRCDRKRLVFHAPRFFRGKKCNVRVLTPPTRAAFDSGGFKLRLLYIITSSQHRP